MRAKSLLSALLATALAGGCHAGTVPAGGSTAPAEGQSSCASDSSMGSPVAALTGQAASERGSDAVPLWSMDYETADLRSFKVTPENNDPMAPQVTSAQARSGRYSGEYTIPPGGIRSENVPAPSLPFSEGDERWFAFSSQLGTNIPLATNEWQLFGQWKNDGDGSPPLALYVNAGVWKLSGGWGWPGTNAPTDPAFSEASLGAAVGGQWEDWLVHIRFSSDPTTGAVGLWRNGANLLCDWHPTGGTLYPGRDSYMKVGYYRSDVIDVTGTVYFDDVSVWDGSVGGETD